MLTGIVLGLLLQAAPSPATLDGVAFRLHDIRATSPQARFVSMRGGVPVTLPNPSLQISRGRLDDGAVLVFTDEAGRSRGIKFGVGGVMSALEAQCEGGHWQLSAAGILKQTMPADAPEFCAAATPTSPVRSIATRAALNPAAGVRIATVAIDADQSYVALFGGDEDAALAGIVAQVAGISAIYERDLGIRIELAFARLWPEGGEPFEATDLAGFRNYWQDEQDSTPYNLVHLFSGRRDTLYGGIAYLATACNGSAFGVSAFLTGSLPDELGPPDLDAWDITVVAHEMGHNLGTYHTHDGYDPVIDDCGNGVSAPRGTIMSYCHIHQGGVLNLDQRIHARVADVILELNPEGDCLVYDCNGNSIDDADDIGSGQSGDMNTDGIPDECQDCNGNGVLDPDDIAGGTSQDADSNMVPDECQADCNGNGVPDAWDVAALGADDINGNRVPDVCEPDCDGNGVIDFADIQLDHALDEDRDGILDLCQACTSAELPEWSVFGGTGNILAIAQDGSLREYLGSSGVLVDVAAPAPNGAVPLSLCRLDIGVFSAFMPRGTMLVGFDDGSVRGWDAGLVDPPIDFNISGMQEVRAMVTTPSGTLLMADTLSDRIMSVSVPNPGIPAVLVGPGPGGVLDPMDMLVLGDYLLVVSHVRQVRRFNRHTGAFIDVLIEDAAIEGATSIAMLPDGDLAVTSPLRQTVQQYDVTTGFPRGSFTDEYSLSEPTDIVSIRGQNMLVPKAAQSYARLVEYDQTGRYIRSLVRGDSGLTAPKALAIRGANARDCNGNGRPDECDIAEGGDANNNGTLDDCECYADIIPDGVVGADDLLAIIGAWGQLGGPEDIDGSGTVDTGDLLLVLGGWGPC